MFRPLSTFIALAMLAGTAHAQEREWVLDTSEEDAYLIFGVPDSDDVGVSLWCPIGRGVVNLFVPRPTEELRKLKRKTVPLTVTAEGETATFAGKVDINAEAATSSAEAEIPANHALMKAMAKADRFSVRVAGEEVVYPLYAADLAGLFDLCAKR